MNGISEKTPVAAAEKTPPSRRLPVWVIVIAFLVLAGFMALIGWGLSRAMRGGMVVGDSAPQFAMTTFDGQEINTADYAGKVLVINFWASWCKPCEQEARELEEAYQYFRDSGEVAFLGLAYVDTEPNSLAYLEKFGITYPNGPDLATRISQMFRVRGVPETMIIDRQGKLVHYKKGPFASTREIIALVDGVLQK
jgi:cytochrome c biogenesis protein CcmG/thiol:disulfide interchange protein DsbE